MNLYFISAPDPRGTDDRLDAFLYANDEFKAFQLWLDHQIEGGRMPANLPVPNYDLYLLPHDPMLRSRGIACIIPWSLDGTGGVDGSGTVQLISSSWMEPDRKPVGLNASERSSIIVALAISQQTLRGFAADLRTRLLTEEEEKALRFLDAELARIAIISDRIKTSGES